MQSTNNIFLVKPAKFGYNHETAVTNVFQNNLIEDKDIVVQKAIQEFEKMAQQLTERGVNVIVINDTEHPIKPDAIFPNNWISLHADGTLVLYPMLAENRRLERRSDITQLIKERFDVKTVIDLSVNEQKDIFLEGTGSIIFDHTNRVAYACLSPRTNKVLFEEVCHKLNYTPITFYSYDNESHEIYHTNVMLTIGNGYAVICLESIRNASERALVTSSFKQTGHKLIEISIDQMNSFCGNMLEIELPSQKNILAMSNSAFQSLTKNQKQTLESYCELFPLNIETIETIGGGSVRCMIAEIFLPCN